MGSLANSSSLQTTIQENLLLLPLSAFSQLSLLTLKPSPRLRLMPTTAITTGTVWLTTGTGMLIMDTTDTPMLTMATTTARGLLMLSPRLMPSTDTTDTDWLTTDTDMAWLTMDTMVMPTLMLMVTTTARGLLMLSPRLMPTTDITTAMLPVDTTAILMLTMATTATDIIIKLLLFCSRI